SRGFWLSPIVEQLPQPCDSAANDRVLCSQAYSAVMRRNDGRERWHAPFHQQRRKLKAARQQSQNQFRRRYCCPADAVAIISIKTKGRALWLAPDGRTPHRCA